MKLIRCPVCKRYINGNPRCKCSGNTPAKPVLPNPNKRQSVTVWNDGQGRVHPV